MTEQEQIKRGLNAKALLENPVWIELWDAFRIQCLAQMENGDDDQMRNAKLYLLAMKDVQRMANRWLGEGKFAEEVVKEEEKRKRKWPWAA